MKKIFTLSLTLATGLTAMAVAPEVTLSENVVKTPEVSKVTNSTPVAVKPIRVSTKLNDALPSAGAPMALPAASSVNMYYTNPAGTYSGTVYIKRPDGNRSYFDMGIVTAPYASLTYNNKSSYLEDGNYKNVVDGDYNFSWTNYSCDYVNGSLVPEESFNLTFNSEPNEYANYGYYGPTLILNGVEYQKPNVWNDEESQELWQCGGILVTEEEIETLKQRNPTLSDFHYVALPYSVTDPRFEGTYKSGVFMTGTERSNGLSNTDECISSFEDLFELSGVTDITNIEGFFQDFKVVAPMAISSAHVFVVNKNLNGAKVKVDFYYLENGESVGEPFNSLEYEFASSTSLTTTEITIPFRSNDDAGFVLDYMIVDKDFRMVVSGVEDSKFREFAMSIAGMSCYGNGEWPGKWAHAYRPSVYSEFNLGGLVKGIKDGVQGTYAVRSTYYNGFTNDDETSTACDPVSFQVGFDLEYPYLQASAAAFNGATTLEGIDLAKEYTVNIMTANDDAVYRVNCPGSLDDILVETVDGEDLPEWLYYEINQTTIAKPSSYADATPNYFALIFALTDGATPGGCEVKVSYKGQYNIFKINPSLSGIEGVVDNGAETVASEYYDLQGRKLSVEPMNGLFIRKDVKADGSVKAVKVVK
ncbi:MAG: hypothetical protein NC127_00865 [Muribaculum sp.]|nr:hypothetical protein [Muribaculum sp.]